MAERMTSESWRVVRFSRYSVRLFEESAKTINQCPSGSQVVNITLKPKYIVNDLSLTHNIKDEETIYNFCLNYEFTFLFE